MTTNSADLKDAITTPYVQYRIGKTLLFVFIPALIMLVLPYVLSILDPLGRTVVLSAYYLFEAILLLGVLAFVARHENTSIKAVIGYCKKTGWVAFVALAAIGAIWAIMARDYWQVPGFMSLSRSIMDLLPGWPSIYSRLPQDDGVFAALGTGGEALALLFGTIAVVCASIMQSLYFRGFLLSRLDWLGWRAPALITGLFAMFHLGSPFFWHQFLLLSLPWAFIAFRTKNVWIVVVSHAVMNGYSGMFALVALGAGG